MYIYSLFIFKNKYMNPNAFSCDDNLANVLLIPKSQIENYLTEQKKLKTDLEDLENKMEIKA